MPTNYPAALDALPNPGPTTECDDPGFELDIIVSNIHDCIEALEGKLGIGSSAPGSRTALIGTPTGSVWEPLARRNRLVNGAMRVALISGSSTDVSTPAEGWTLLGGAPTAGSAGPTPSTMPRTSPMMMRLSVYTAPNNKFGIFQPLESAACKDLAGGVVSLQFAAQTITSLPHIRAAIVAWTGTADNGGGVKPFGDPINAWGATGVLPTYLGSWANCNAPVDLPVATTKTICRIENVAVPSNMTNLAVFIWCDATTEAGAGHAFDVTDVQLEAGAVCTDYERIPLAVDELVCGRLAELLGAVASTAPGIAGYGTAGMFAAAYPTFAVTKRTPPTVTVVGTWTVGNCSQPVAGAGSVHGCRLITTVTAAGGFFFEPTSSSTYLFVNSRLMGS